MKDYLLFVVIAFTLINYQRKESPVNKEKPTDLIVIGQIDSVYSKILNESRKIWVHIPESTINDTYNETKYPVLYLLDGLTYFHSVTGMINQLSPAKGNGIVPEMIIVAIPNTNRSRDFTPTHVDINFFSGDSVQSYSGGADTFLDFMEEELIPHIERMYPAARHRTFVGSSLGGLSVINALISRPHLFHNYIAIDPSLWWDNQTLLKLADSVLNVNKFDGRGLFMGVANTMDEGMNINTVRNDTSKFTFHIRSILQFANSTDNKDDNGLLFGWKYYHNDDHSSVAHITVYDALRFLFSWYAIQGLDQFYDPSLNTTTEELINFISSHFEKISALYGFRVLPRELFINYIGYELLNNNMPDKAYAMFNLNIQNYPNSANVFDSMGDYYLSQSDTLNAIEHFTKALEIGDIPMSKRKLDKLKNDE